MSVVCVYIYIHIHTYIHTYAHAVLAHVALPPAPKKPVSGNPNTATGHLKLHAALVGAAANRGGKDKDGGGTDKVNALQGSLHYTPEHCLVNGGFNLYFGVEKATCFKWLQNEFLLRSPVQL